MITETRKVPLLDMQPEIQSIWDELITAVEGVLRKSQFIMGPNVKEFEREVAQYLGVKHAIGVNSGTDALVIACQAIGLQPGDEVITTPFTFFATGEAVSHFGAIPVFVDIDPRTFNLDVSKIEAKITSRTKAILPVHLYGHSADMDPLMALAKKHGLKVIEDVAQAFGCDYKGRKAGTIGDIGCFSFFPSKNLGGFGDAGMIVTNDEEFAVECAMLRVHGAKKKYFNEVVGYNSRLDEIQAAMLRVKLPRIDEANAGRRRAAEIYNELLGDVPAVITPLVADYTTHVYHQYTIRIQEGKRDSVQEKLAVNGVSTFVYYPVSIDKLPVYEGLTKQNMPNCELCSAEALSLPIWPQIERETQEYVANAIKAAL